MGRWWRVRRVALAVAIACCFTMAAPLSTAYASSGCDKAAALISGCPNVGGSVGDDSARLVGDISMPGGSRAPSAGGATGAGQPPRPCQEVFAGLCYGEGRGKPVDGDSATPAVTLRDIALFRPQPATQRMQPDGWMIVGLDTNFYALIDRHIVSGSLLGAAADVRFTPVGYRWRYGDGSSARLTSKGSTWQALGASEFDPTPTSHIYRASGTYVIDLDVEYTAEYRFAGGGWVPLSGTIVLPANRLVATAGDAVTVLVDRHCAQPPAGVGC